MQIFHSGHQNNLLKQQNAIYYAKTQHANFPVWTAQQPNKTANKYPRFQFSPFNCCLSVVL